MVVAVAVKPRTSTTARTVLSLVNNMAFITPSVRAATLTEIAPAAAFPAASRLAALIVEDATEAGTPADAACCDSTAAKAPPEIARP